MATSYVAVGTAVNMIADSRYPPKKNPAARAGLNQSQSKIGSYIARRGAAVACRSVNSLLVGRRGPAALGRDLVADLLSFVQG